MTRRPKPSPLPESRIERGIKLRRSQPQLGSVMIAIDTALRQLNNRIDKSERNARPRGTGSVIGSVVQVPRENPEHETHFDYLETVRVTLEQLVMDAP